MPENEAVRFRAGELTLAGTLTWPVARPAGRVPWALLLPSWLPRDRDGAWDVAGHTGWFADDRDADRPLARLADALAELGVASLRFDPRGCGASGGSWEASDLFTRIDDARDAIGAMRSRRDLDLRRTAIVGHGEGAVIALSVAIGDPAVGAVGLIGPPARSYRDVLRRSVSCRNQTATDREHPIVRGLDRLSEELIERVERHEPEQRVPLAGGDATFRLAGWDQAFRTPAFALATMLHRQVVIGHGMADAWAHPDESRLLAAILRDAGNDPILQLVDGAGHGLEGATTDGAMGAFASALAGRMEARELPPVLVAIEGMGDSTLDSRP